MQENNVRELVFSFMKMTGMEPKEDCKGIWSVVVPENERNFFNGFGELRFTFDREKAEKQRDIQLACEGSFLLRKIIERLGSIPKVSRLFKKSSPELHPVHADEPNTLRVVTPGKVHYRQQVVFNFKVVMKCDTRDEKHFSAVADPACNEIYLREGLSEIDLDQYSETPDQGIPIYESGEDMLRLFLMTCRELEGRLSDQIIAIGGSSKQRFVSESEKIRKYLDEQKQELQKKKENVCFHLYFFQKEEEIEKLIRDLDNEYERKIRELKEKFELQVEISLINALILGVPTIGEPVSRTGKKNLNETFGSTSPLH